MRWMLRPPWRARSRTTGYPTSTNGASSLHLFWDVPRADRPVVAASVDLVVESLPGVDDLYFWALQATFADATGRRRGGGHVGLQWHAGHPGHRAVNWGGYAPDGVELAGSPSSLPSATGNPNTRDLAWRPGRPYRLRIGRTPGGWTAWVDGVEVRTLHAGGDRLVGVVTWAEVFARCDAPPVAVRWCHPAVERADGRMEAVPSVRVGYQARRAGGCDNTTALAGADGVRQITGTARVTPPGVRLALTAR